MFDRTTSTSPTLDESDPAEAGSEDLGFAELVTKFALSLQDVASPPLDLVEQIVSGAIRLVPGAQHAAVVTADQQGQLSAAAVAGNGVPRRVMALQNDLLEGPCRDAIADGKLVVTADVAIDIRWSTFGPAAASAGAGSMLCIPLIVNARTIGALTLIGDSNVFDDEAQSLGRVFAAHAAIALAAARTATNLNTALSSRDVIGQAKGILMERFRLTPELAFTALVKASADANVKLRTVCEQLCDTGLLVGKQGRKQR